MATQPTSKGPKGTDSGPSLTRTPSRPRRRVWLGILLLLVLLLVAGGMAATIYRSLDATEDESAESAATSSPGAGPEPTATPDTGGPDDTPVDETPAGDATTTSRPPEPPALLSPQDAEASSALAPQDQNTYGPANLLDGDLRTAWNEDAEGWGEGEWVRFSFSSPVTLSHLEIANGYQKDDRRFTGNGRVRTIRLDYSSGGSTTATLADALGYQSVDVDAEPLSWVRITVVSVYEGRLWEDTALSEVRFYGREQ